MAKDEGLSPHEYLEAIRLYKKMVGGIESEKRVDLQTACEAFIERQKRENRNRRTIYSDSQALKYLCQFAGWKLPLVELTEARINEYFDTMKPGGRRRTQHSRVKKFLQLVLPIRLLGLQSDGQNQATRKVELQPRDT